MPWGSFKYGAAIAALVIAGPAAAGNVELVGSADTVVTQINGGHEGLTGLKLRFKALPFGEQSEAQAPGEDSSAIAKVVDRAASWWRALDLGLHGGESTGSRLATPQSPAGDGGTGSSIMSLARPVDADLPATMFNAGAWRAWQSMSQTTLSASDGNWMMHPLPSTSFVTASGTTPTLSRPLDADSTIGRAMSEQTLAGHDIEVGLPLSQWMAISGSHYWFGAQDVTQEVRGNRVGLKLTPTPYVAIEGGRMQDSERNNGTFVSARLSIPFGTQ
jgi:hypothetical protein